MLLRFLGSRFLDGGVLAGDRLARAQGWVGTNLGKRFRVLAA